MVHPRIIFKHNTFLLELGLTRNMGLQPPVKTSPKKRWDVRDIPSDKRVCVHVEVEVDPEDPTVITKIQRCTRTTRLQQNGFLCGWHQKALDPPMPPTTDLHGFYYDALVIKDIIISEALLIFEANVDGKVESTRLDMQGNFLRTITN